MNRTHLAVYRFLWQHNLLERERERERVQKKKRKIIKYLFSFESHVESIDVR